jgi:hypothetical protein
VQREQRDERLGVGTRREARAIDGELAAEVKVVVDLAVPRHDHAPAKPGRAERLRTALRVEEREPPVGERDMPRMHHAGAVRAAMGKQVAERVARLLAERDLPASRCRNSKDSAHARRLRLGCGSAAQGYRRCRFRDEACGFRFGAISGGITRKDLRGAPGCRTMRAWLR